MESGRLGRYRDERLYAVEMEERDGRLLDDSSARPVFVQNEAGQQPGRRVSRRGYVTLLQL